MATFDNQKFHLESSLNDPYSNFFELAGRTYPTSPVFYFVSSEQIDFRSHKVFRELKGVAQLKTLLR